MAKIIHARKNISLEESTEIADFEALFKVHEQSSGRRAKSGKYSKRTGLIFILLVALTLITYNQYHQAYQKELDINPEESVEIDSDKGATEVLEYAEKTQKNHELPSIEEGTENEAEQNKTERKEIENGEKAKDMESSFVEARPIIGYPALYQYFDENLIYLDSLVEKQIVGRVIVGFDIDTTGRPAKIIVEIPLYPILDNLALELVAEMPTWFPAELNGKLITSSHRIPLHYRIDEDK